MVLAKGQQCCVAGMVVSITWLTLSTLDSVSASVLINCGTTFMFTCSGNCSYLYCQCVEHSVGNH